MAQLTPGDSFPWHLGVYDAHCHPTDTMASVVHIPQMKAASLTIMATRGEDQDLVAQAARSAGKNSWGDDHVVPCFGWHPWFSHQIRVDDDAAIATAISIDDQKNLHYKAVLVPPPQRDDFISTLPDPIPLSMLIAQTRERLLGYPTGLVGEIGLDHSFRLPRPWTNEEVEGRDESLTLGSREGRKLSPYRVHMGHQKAVFEAQLRLAGELQRPVSIHSVQAHGAVFEVLKKLWIGHERKRLSRRERLQQYDAEAETKYSSKSGSECEGQAGSQNSQKGMPGARDRLISSPLPYPPRICMHSYTGSVEPIRQFLRPENPSDVYFSFSAVINFDGPSAQKAMDVVRCLPADRLLVESDIHMAGKRMDDLLEKAVRTICQLRGWPLHDGVQQLGDNWRRFVLGHNTQPALHLE